MLEYDFEKRCTSEKLFLEFRKKFPNNNKEPNDVEEIAASNLNVDHNTVCNSILLTLKKVGWQKSFFLSH